MVEYVLIPSALRKWLLDYVRVWTEERGMKLVSLCRDRIDDYSDEMTVEGITTTIEANIQRLISDMEEGDDVYQICVGGILHNIVVWNELVKRGIIPKLLVFEKKIGNYVTYKYVDGLEMLE